MMNEKKVYTNFILVTLVAVAFGFVLGFIVTSRTWREKLPEMVKDDCIGFITSDYDTITEEYRVCRQERVDLRNETRTALIERRAAQKDRDSHFNELVHCEDALSSERQLLSEYREYPAQVEAMKANLVGITSSRDFWIAEADWWQEESKNFEKALKACQNEQ
jgi:hypothetical protein